MGQLGFGGAAAVTVDIRAAASGVLPITGLAVAADRVRVPLMIFTVAREERVFRVAREQTIFTVTREAA